MASFQRLKKISPPIIIPNQIIFHSACDNYGVEGHLSWQLNGSLESHAYTARNGDIYQIVPYNRRAQANLTANGPRSDGTGAISMETGSDIPALHPWTDAQIDAMVEWARERMAEFPTIGARRAPSATAAGIGFHVMWGAPSPWTPVAKTCPGPERIKQFEQVLLPRILRAPAKVITVPGVPGKAAPKPSPSPSNSIEEYLKTVDDQKFKELVRGGVKWTLEDIQGVDPLIIREAVKRGIADALVGDPAFRQLFKEAVKEAVTWGIDEVAQRPKA